MDWFNNRRLLEPIGNIPPAEAEEHYYTMLTKPAMAAWLKRNGLRQTRDGSGANSLEVPDNLTLVPLPPYSPELNPIERVWLFLRERFLSFRLFRDQDDIVEACCRAWNALVEETGRIRSLCDQPWLPKVSS